MSGLVVTATLLTMHGGASAQTPPAAPAPAPPPSPSPTGTTPPEASSPAPAVDPTTPPAPTTAPDPTAPTTAPVSTAPTAPADSPSPAVAPQPAAPTQPAPGATNTVASVTPAPPPPAPEASTWAFGSPAGSRLYATSVAEIGISVGSVGVAGKTASAFGLHYAERHGLLAMLLGAALVGAGAQGQANASNTTITVNTAGMEGSAAGGFSMSMDAYNSRLGGAVDGFALSVYWGFVIGRNSPRPSLFDAGVCSVFLERKETMTGGMVETKSIGGIVGLNLGGLVPITRWAQLDAHYCAALGGVRTADGGLTANVGNRIYVRGSGFYNDALGVVFSTGVRL